MSTELRPLDELLAEVDNLMGHIAGINDERDSVPILLALRERWPEIRAHIERLRARSGGPAAADGSVEYGAGNRSPGALTCGKLGRFVQGYS
jgi:hypothetical protein